MIFFSISPETLFSSASHVSLYLNIITEPDL